MSSSGKGQSVVRTADDVATAWSYAQEAGRTGASDVICEGFVDFDAALLETLFVLRRAGAAFIITYGARRAPALGLA